MSKKRANLSFFSACSYRSEKRIYGARLGKAKLDNSMSISVGKATEDETTEFDSLTLSKLSTDNLNRLLLGLESDWSYGRQSVLSRA